MTTFHLATHAFAEKPADRENIAFFRVDQLTIDTPEPRDFMVDGELGGQTPFTVRCVPRSLRVLVPESAE